jgi:SulP family sulfate permease
MPEMAIKANRLPFFDAFLPKLVTIWREGYSARQFRADIIAGLTVAIVALPLSMAIAIASGVTPDRGLYASIIGGFFVSLLGGSRFQIGGPAGAFIILVAATVATHGVDGLLLATLMSGVFMLAIGYLRLGTFIKYIPYPVTVGFTAGIAVIIFLSQGKDLLGLTLAGSEPGPTIPKVAALYDALPSITPAAVAIGIATMAVIVVIRRLWPHGPAYLIAIAIAALASYLLGLPVETIGTRFGGIPHGLPMPSLPPLSWEKMIEMLPAALSFALLGSIESLLSAVVADSMGGGNHRSNCELVAQGFANIGSALFGGICVTGTIARTATNVRAGGRSPLAGMAHSAFLLIFMLVAAPLAAYLPLAALAGILGVVAWNMAEKHEFATLVRASTADAAVVLVTFLLVVFRDLTEGILIGFGLGALLFLHRMARAIRIDTATETADDKDEAIASDPDILAYRISGAFFFGSAASVAAALDRIGEHPKAYVLDFSAVPVIDSTAATTIDGFASRVGRRGAKVYVAATSRQVRRALLTHHVRPPRVKFRRSLDEAMAAARAEIGKGPSAPAEGR